MHQQSSGGFKFTGRSNPYTKPGTPNQNGNFKLTKLKNVSSYEVDEPCVRNDAYGVAGFSKGVSEHYYENPYSNMTMADTEDMSYCYPSSNSFSTSRWDGMHRSMTNRTVDTNQERFQDNEFSTVQTNYDTENNRNQFRGNLQNNKENKYNAFWRMRQNTGNQANTVAAFQDMVRNKGNQANESNQLQRMHQESGNRGFDFNRFQRMRKDAGEKRNQCSYPTNQSQWLNPVPNTENMIQNMVISTHQEPVMTMSKNQYDAQSSHTATNQGMNTNRAKPRIEIKRSEPAGEHSADGYRMKRKDAGFLRLLTGPVDKVVSWSKHRNLLLMIEVVGTLDNIRQGRFPCEKVLLLKDTTTGAVLQVVFFEIDQKLPLLKPGTVIKCVGSFTGRSQMQAFKVCESSAAENMALQHISFICNRAVQELTNTTKY